MVPISVCIEPFYLNLPVEERIAKIAKLGFKAIEFWHPEATFDGKGISTDLAKNPESIKKACEANGVKLAGFAANAWDGLFGGRPIKSGDRKTYLEQINRMIDFAEKAGCKKAITLSGTEEKGLSRTQMRKNLNKALEQAVEIAEKRNFTLILEPLNTLVDHGGYYLGSSKEGAEIVREIGSPNLKLLYDIYHMQIMEGNVIANIEKNIDIIGHFHSAGVPGRGELFGGELDYAEIYKRISALKYDGYFGLEYFPKIKDDATSLKKVLAYLRGN